MPRIAAYADKRRTRDQTGRRVTEPPSKVYRCKWCPESLDTPKRHNCAGTRAAERTMRKIAAGTF